MIVIQSYRDVPAKKITVATVLALLSLSCSGGQTITFDSTHPLVPTGVPGGIVTEGSGSDNTIIIRTDNVIKLNQPLTGVNVNDSATSNLIQIQSAPGESWFTGTKIQGVYVGNAGNNSEASKNRLLINGGKYRFSFANGMTVATLFNGAHANDNTLEIRNADITGSLVGAHVINGSAPVTNNRVLLHDGSYQRTNDSTANNGIYAVLLDRASTKIFSNSINISGAGDFDQEEIAAVNINTGSPSSVDNNIVTLDGGQFRGGTIYGVKGQIKGPSQGNGVVINGGHFSQKTNIYAVQTITNKAKHDNFIRINAQNPLDLSHVSLHGTSNLSSGRLIINQPKNLTIGSLHKFNTVELRNVLWQTTDPAVRIKTDAGFKKVSIAPEAGFILAENEVLRAGDRMTLIRSEAGLSFDNVLTDPITDTVVSHINVARSVRGKVVIDQADIDYVVDSVELAEQTFLLAENRGVTAAFLNEGADHAISALDLPASLKGYELFAIAQGSAGQYDINSLLKINGWHYAFGMHGKTDAGQDNRIIGGLYLETGMGNYRTFNTFNTESFRGDGEVSYLGLGLAARYETSGGWYADASLRAGELKTEMSRALRNAAGHLIGIQSDTSYVGGHMGFGRVMENDRYQLALYGRGYWLSVDGDSLAVEGDVFRFGDINSYRLRFGGRLTSKKLGFYAGAAVEHEFDGDVTMTAADLRAPDESLEGESYLGELGWSSRLSSLPLTVDLKLTGWTGEHDGVMGKALFAYEW